MKWRISGAKCGQFWGLEASIFWDKPYCQTSLGSHHFDSILARSSSRLHRAFPSKCSTFVFSIFRTSISLSLFYCSLLFPFRGTVARMQSILSRVWSGRGKKKSGSFTDEPNSISEFCGFAWIFISVRGCVLCIMVLDFCLLQWTAKPEF